MAQKGKELSKVEKGYISENAGKMSVSAIARHLGRDRRTVGKFLKNNQISDKVVKESTGKTALQEFSLNKSFVTKSLSEAEREQFFKDNLQNTQYYTNLKKQFTEEELDYYLEEWGALCVQFEDIITTDKRQIDEYIKTGIIGNRILRNIKSSEDEIEGLMEEAEVLGNVKEIEEDEDMQQRYDTLRHLILTFSSQVQHMVNDYGKNQDARSKLLESLNTRRKDRVNQIKKSGTSLFDLIQTLDEPEYRDEQGYYLEVMKLSKEHLKHEWREPSLFPDGIKDCVLIDEHSIEPERTFITSLEGSVETIKNLMVGGPKLNILVVHNGAAIFPKELTKALTNHNTVYIQKYEDFEEIIGIDSVYQYVILGYKLNDNMDCRDVGRHIIENDFLPKAKFFITSTTQTYIDEVANTLIGYREYEVCLTDEIKEKLNGKNSE